eukprot:TRINITY_DN26888_c0_g1_i2.p1 TRINITY_DN26888_c0_g1~~TRINITY_DN26888_c0_g1_i2.p1  ORF type:complete len:543 (+),score=133.17 TRINITY_DN26888_c0_g1_i2:50-1678(+)
MLASNSLCKTSLSLRTLLRLLLLVIVGAAVAAEGKVRELTAKNFDASLREHSISFIEFYAPWCGHCQKLTPEWERTAELSKNLDVLVGKVDAIQEKTLAQEHGVSSFPTLKLFRKNSKVSKIYNGARTAQSMVEWLKVWEKAELLQRPKLETGLAKSLVGGDKHFAIIGLLSGKNEKDEQLKPILEGASFVLNPQHPAGEVPVMEVLADDKFLIELGAPTDLKTPCVVALRDFAFEEKVLVHQFGSESFEKEFDSTMKWLTASRVPAFIPARSSTQQFFLEDIDPHNGLVIYFGSDQKLRQEMHELAVQFGKTEKRLKWVHGDDEPSNDDRSEFAVSLAKNVALVPDEFPEVVVWEFGETEDEDKVFRLSQQTDSSMSKSGVKTFVERWQNKTLEEVKDPVVSVTTNDFDKIVLNSKKDVLVKFYAPWCGQCKAIAPVYRTLGTHYMNDGNVVIAKMDATLHKHPSAEITQYPTLKFYPKGKKIAPLDMGFKPNREKLDFVKFIEDNRVTTPPKPKKTEQPKKATFSASSSTKQSPEKEEEL